MIQGAGELIKDVCNSSPGIVGVSPGFMIGYNSGDKDLKSKYGVCKERNNTGINNNKSLTSTSYCKYLVTYL